MTGSSSAGRWFRGQKSGLALLQQPFGRPYHLWQQRTAQSEVTDVSMLGALTYFVSKLKNNEHFELSYKYSIRYNKYIINRYTCYLSVCSS